MPLLQARGQDERTESLLKKTTRRVYFREQTCGIRTGTWRVTLQGSVRPPSDLSKSLFSGHTFSAKSNNGSLPISSILNSEREAFLLPLATPTKEEHLELSTAPVDAAHGISQLHSTDRARKR